MTCVLVCYYYGSKLLSLALPDKLECDDDATDVSEYINFIIGVGRIVAIGSTFFRVSVQLFFLMSFSVMTVPMILNAL